jgi:tetratricopeptide (TPR) repeat protein
VEYVVALIAIALVIVVGAWLYSQRTITDAVHYEQRLARATHARLGTQHPVALAEYTKAVQELSRVKVLTPDLKRLLGEARLGQGETLQGLGRTEESVAAYREAVKLMPVSTEVVAVVASDFARRADRSPDALDAYALHAANRRGQADPDRTIELLREQCDSGADDQGIIALSRQLVTADPDLAWAQLALGARLAVRGDPDGVAPLEAAEALLPDNPDVPLQLGTLFFRLNRLDEALAAFRRCLARDPAQPDALFWIARLLLAQAEGPEQTALLDEAARSVQRVCELQPDRAEAWHLRGSIDVARGDDQAARDSLEQAVRLAPIHRDARMDLAMLLARLEDRTAAIATLQVLVGAHPDDVPAHVQLGTLLLAESRKDEAERHFRNAVDVDPQHEEARVGLGRALYTQGRCNEAVELLAPVLGPGAAPGSGSVSGGTEPSYHRSGLYALGRSYALTGQPELAAETFQRWLRTYGPDQDVLFYFGCASGRLGRWQVAAGAFTQARSMPAELRRPGQAALLQGVALAELGQVQEAEAAYRDASALSPDDPNVPYALGKLALQRVPQDVDAAHQAFEQALALDPRFAPAQLGIGLLAEQVGEVEAAEAAYSEGARCMPAWGAGRLRYGVALARAGAWGEAVGELEAAQRLGQDNDELHFYLGLTWAGLGRNEEARGAWSSLLVACPDDAVLWSNLAIVDDRLAREYLDAGRYAEAAECWERCRALRPDVEVFTRGAGEARFRQGVCLLASANGSADLTASAVTALKQALDLDPEDARPRYYLGLAALRDGDIDTAVDLLAPLVNADPDDHGAVYHLAVAQLARRETANAAALLDQLGSAADGFGPGVTVMRANLAMAEGRWSEALTEYTVLATLSSTPRGKSAVPTSASPITASGDVPR